MNDHEDQLSKFYIVYIARHDALAKTDIVSGEDEAEQWQKTTGRRDRLPVIWM
jgi:hypothetical protein